MSRHVNRRSIAIVALLLLSASGAYAYWTNDGSGSGSAATGTATVALTVVQTSIPTGLYPGGPAELLSGKFDNANSYDMHVNSVDAAIASVTGPNIDLLHPCTASDYQLNGFPVTVDADITPGSAQGAWGAGPPATSIQLNETGCNQDGCKDAVVNLDYTSD